MMPVGWINMGDVIRFVLRLPPDLHAKLKSLAEREDRSLHAQIIRILRLAVADDRPAVDDAE